MDTIWFFWPITFASSCAFAIQRLARLRRHKNGNGSSMLGSSAVLICALAFPVIPFTVAMGVRCSDESPVLSANIPALGIGFLGLVGWLALVARFYQAAGDERSSAERSIAIMLLFLLLGTGVEYVASALSLAGYCNDAAGGMVIQLAIAIIVLVGAVLVACARSAATRAAP